jgi:hypothetical protein
MPVLIVKAELIVSWQFGLKLRTYFEYKYAKQ